MPRAARQKSESKIYHVLVRGINRQTIFEDGDDASKYLSTLKRYKEEDAYMLYAYCLMGNHIHLLLKEEKEDLGIIMRRIGAAAHSGASGQRFGFIRPPNPVGFGHLVKCF